MDNGIFPENILYGIAAAFKFNYENDVSAPEVSSFVSRKGIEKAIIKYTGIKKQSPLFREIVKKYENL
jgi:mannitol-1-phosphate 5-dehydrogenase